MKRTKKTNEQLVNELAKAHARITALETSAIKLEGAEEALERRAAQLALLNDIGGQIAAELDLDPLLDRATRLVQESFDYHHVALFTLDRERGELVMRSRAGDFGRWGRAWSARWAATARRCWPTTWTPSCVTSTCTPMRYQPAPN